MEQENSIEQPQGLKVLCVLTFIYSGLLGFCLLLCMVMAKPIFQKMEEMYPAFQSNPDMSEKQLEQIDQFLKMGSGTFILLCGGYLLILGLSFYGALQMWQMKYRGFVTYMVANSVILAFNLVSLNIFMIVIDVLFMGLYYWQSRSLKRETN